MTLFTFPFNALGWPALALPCGGRDGFSIAPGRRPAGRRLVLAAGRRSKRRSRPERPLPKRRRYETAPPRPRPRRLRSLVGAVSRLAPSAPPRPQGCTRSSRPGRGAAPITPTRRCRRSPGTRVRRGAATSSSSRRRRVHRRHDPLTTTTYHDARRSIQLQVPWMTGIPYALWARVRAIRNGTGCRRGASRSASTRSGRTCPKRAAPTGLIHWTPVEGATGTRCSTSASRVATTLHFTTLTNVADEREWWSFHEACGDGVWRVRAFARRHGRRCRTGSPSPSTARTRRSTRRRLRQRRSGRRCCRARLPRRQTRQRRRRARIS